MRLRHDDVPGVAGPARLAVVGVAGSAWGLGLARLLAETGPQTFLYTSPVGVALVALACALTAAAVWRLPSSSLRPAWALPLALPALYTLGTVADPLAGGVLLVGGAGLAALGAMGMAQKDRQRWVLPLLLGLITLALYLRTLLPSIGEADTLEFQVVAAKLGVAHPTGYPLYILLSKPLTWLPLKNVAWRVNLGSAIFATAAVVVLHAIIHRLTDRPLLSFLSAFAFAFSRVFWSQAVIAEVYTLHNLLVALILFLLLRGRGAGEAGESGEARRWQAILFLMGLSLTNHLTTALLFPATAVAFIWDRPRLRTRDWLVAGGLLLLGLSVLLFIPLRWPALNDGQLMTLRDFVSYVTGGAFHGALRLAGWRDPARWRIVGRLLHVPFGWVGIGLAVLGAVELSIRDRRALALTGVTFVAFFVYGLDYVVADIAVFLLPAHAILAIWMGCGAALLARWLSSIPLSAPGWAGGGLWRPGLATLIALIPLSRIWINLPAVDQSHDKRSGRIDGGIAWGQYALSRPLVEGSAILADTKKFAPLYYLQQVEGVRPDLDIVLLGSEDLYQADLQRRLGAGQTVYLARYLPHLEGLHMRSVGPLVEIDGESRSGQGPLVGGRLAASDPLARFEAGIHLLGAEVDEDPLGRALYHVTLYWQAQAEVGSVLSGDDLVVRLRLVDGGGQARWTGGGERPVNGLYPTNAWRGGVAIADYHAVEVPPWLPPDIYSLEIGLFAPFESQGVTVEGGSTAWVPVETLDVKPPSGADPMPHRRLYSFEGGVWLTGFDAAGEVMPGAPFVVDLAWRGVEEGERVQLWWEDADRRQAAVAEFALVEELFRSRHTITAPGKAGRYTLQVGLVDKVARCSWLTSPRIGCSLTEVKVLSGDEGLANFGDRVLLLDVEAPEGGARPGDVIPVTLRWRGLRAMDKDYTVFVHLVGPDGRLHGQADSWPVQGTYPTSQWAPGGEVTDPYEVRLEGDAPAGPYRVEVGWYNLETMQRLQIVDEEGLPVADSYVVGGFEVRN